MTVYGRPDNASADDEAPARFSPHVCSIPLCLSAHLPSSCFLSFFFPSTFHSQPSCLPSFLLLCFFSQQSHISFTYLYILDPHRAFQSEPIYLPCLPLRIREFSSPCPSAIRLFFHLRVRIGKKNSQQHMNTHTHSYIPENRTVVRFCL